MYWPDMAAALRLTAVALFAATWSVALPAPAEADDELWLWPSSGSLALAGHGYGHGRGLSQWGAYGAASAGLDHSAILRHYYPGAAIETRADAAIRVWITGDSDGETRIVPTAGLRASAAAGGLTLPVTIDGISVSWWRVIRPPAGLVLQGYARGHLANPTHWRHDCPPWTNLLLDSSRSRSTGRGLELDPVSRFHPGRQRRDSRADGRRQLVGGIPAIGGPRRDASGVAP